MKWMLEKVGKVTEEEGEMEVGGKEEGGEIERGIRGVEGMKWEGIKRLSERGRESCGQWCEGEGLGVGRLSL